jgi:hypothetical protein
MDEVWIAALKIPLLASAEKVFIPYYVGLGIWLRSGLEISLRDEVPTQCGVPTIG